MNATTDSAPDLMALGTRGTPGIGIAPTPPTRAPQFGTDYDIGWIFFTDVRGLMSDGIGWFERWDRGASERRSVGSVDRGSSERQSVGSVQREGSDAPTLDSGPAARSDASTSIVTHTGVVVGDNVCIEAHWQNGVAKAFLDKYPADQIIFRQPRGWTVTAGIHIAAAAAGKLGCQYNKGLILSQLLANTFLGHWVNRLCGGAADRWVSARLDARNEFICSELCAYALNEQPQYRGRGVLARPLDTISPQMLFEEQSLWEPGNYPN